jgi:hypothetical protein
MNYSSLLVIFFFLLPSSKGNIFTFVGSTFRLVLEAVFAFLSAFLILITVLTIEFLHLKA